ncbi:hypothetical protein [Maricaulis sp.]|uniref:hypothetical protein n=1 Tax=Maricaulis sp. TaxID=1486257 RepID=UPI003A8F2BF5
MSVQGCHRGNFVYLSCLLAVLGVASCAEETEQGPDFADRYAAMCAVEPVLDREALFANPVTVNWLQPLDTDFTRALGQQDPYDVQQFAAVRDLRLGDLLIAWSQRGSASGEAITLPRGIPEELRAPFLAFRGPGAGSDYSRRLDQRSAFVMTVAEEGGDCEVADAILAIADYFLSVERDWPTIPSGDPRRMSVEQSPGNMARSIWPWARFGADADYSPMAQIYGDLRARRLQGECVHIESMPMSEQPIAASAHRTLATDGRASLAQSIHEITLDGRVVFRESRAVLVSRDGAVSICCRSPFDPSKVAVRQCANLTPDDPFSYAARYQFEVEN